MFSNLIIGLVELEHKDEKGRMQENKCGGVDIENTHEEGNVHHLKKR